MKFGVYKDNKHFAELQATSIDEQNAVKAADRLAMDEGGSFSVVILGVQTPDRIWYQDHFAPKMIYKVRRG